MKYWLLKSEPFKYSWDQLIIDKKTYWDGVRNYQARNNLQAMQKKDRAFFYHSNEGLCIVGIVEIIKTAYQDPTTDDNRWVAVDIKPIKKLKNPVLLAEMKQQPGLENLGLIRQGRLSVSPVTEEEYKIIMKMAGEKI